MASIDRIKVRMAFRQVYLGVVNLPPINHWQFENQSFDPKGLSFWGKESLLIVDERLVATKLLGLTAILQLDLNVPQGSGTEIIEAASKTLLELLKAGTHLNLQDEPNFAVALDTATPMSARIEDSWYRIPHSFFFRTYQFSDV